MVMGSAIRAGRAFVELFADDTMLLRTLRRAERQVLRFGEHIKAIGRRMMSLGLVAAIPFAASLKTYAEFDDVMRAVKAVTGAVGEEFDLLTEKAKFLGRTTSFTTSQIAEAMLEFGRAGFAPKEIDDAIAGILNLARATKTDLAETTRIAANALRAFNLPADDMGRICDVMVAAVNSSSQTLDDLGLSMNYCAPIAEKYGMTLEETCKAIGALSNYGIKASQAGTTFRRILVNLADKDIQRRLKQLGVAVQDIKTGNMRNVAAVLKDLGVATEKMSKSKKLMLFKEVFGVWALAGGASLTAAEFDRLYDAVDNAGGVAERTAKEMDRGLAGSMRMLWSAVEAVAIAIGEALNPVLQPLVDWMTRACSGLVVFITNNKELIVTLGKTIAAIFGIGLALFTVGLGFIAVGKIIGTVGFAVAAVTRVFYSIFGIIGGCFTAITFIGKSFVSVFTGIAKTITAVGMMIAGTLRIACLVLIKLGAIAFTVVGGIVRAVLMLASGILGGLWLILRIVVAVIATAVPIIASVISTLASVFVSCVSTIISVLGTIFAAFAPLVATCILGLQMIAGAILISFASIAYVVASAFAAVGAVIASVCVTIITGILSAFAALGAMIVATLAPIIAAVAGFFASAFAFIGSIVTTAITAVVSFIGAMMSTVVAWLVSTLSSLVASASIAIATLITAIGGWIAGVLAAMSPILVVLLSVATAVGAVYLLVASLGKIGSIIGNILMGVVNVIGNCLSSILWTVVAFGVSVAAKFLQCFSWIVSGIWGLVKQVGSVLASGVGRIVSGIRGALTSAWDTIVSTFKTAFNLIGDIVTAFGNFFLSAFSSVGTAVEWLREQFGHLCSFAVETYGALVAALGRGDIEAAINLIWASIKLIWVQGSNAILSTWHWLIDTLQTAWATCVYKISELLTKAWYGVQECWTESVYTMQTIWAEFSHGVITAWKKAEEAIAQGIGWIIAKMEGLDPNEMAKTIADDYDRQARDRENQKTQRLKEIQSDRDKRMGLLEDEKQGTLDILQSDFDKAAGMRNAAYQAKLAAQERELEAAKAAYDEAIDRAKNPPPVPEGEEPETLVDKLKRKANELMRGLDFNFGDKVSVTGSFSAAAIESMGVGTTMDRVAKATEQSEKHLAKIAGKDDKKEKQPEAAKKNEPEEKPVEEGLVVKELKQHTRYLRDLSGNGLGAKFA